MNTREYAEAQDALDRMTHPLNFTYDNDRHGKYEVRDGVVCVVTEFGTKTTQVGVPPPLVIARLLAGELMAAKLK